MFSKTVFGDSDTTSLFITNMNNKSLIIFTTLFESLVGHCSAIRGSAGLFAGREGSTKSKPTEPENLGTT